MASRPKHLLALAFAITLAAGTSAAALEPNRAGQESFLSRAVFADGQLWLLSDAGVLSSIAEGKDERLEVSLPDPALDLWLQDGQPAVITCARDHCADWTLRRRTNGEWNVETRIPTQDDEFIASGRVDAGVTLLTSRRIIDVVGDRQSTTALSRPFGRGPAIITTHVAADSVFIGSNLGEWGGGLLRINRKTGAFATIERNTSGQLCGGPLNGACDPVNGIAAAPWSPGCVVIAIGLVHFAPHGRIVEVCGDDVKRLYVKAYGPPPPDEVARKFDEPRSSVAFFGLVRRGDVLWAVGIDGIYRVGPDGAERSAPLPAFKRIGGVGVSFDLPDVVLVLTDVNRRNSVSGSVPMMVPR